MRKIIFLLLSLLSQPLFAQPNSTKIAEIRQAVERINGQKNYVVKTLSNEAFMLHVTDGGGQLSGYFKDGQLIKIVEWIGLSNCIDTTEYYLQDGKLIFAYTQGKVFKYDEQKGAFNSSIQSVAMEARFYFSGANVLRYLLKGETIYSGQPLKSWAPEYVLNCKRYVKLLSLKP